MIDGKVLELMVNTFLVGYNRGEEVIPPSLIEEFGEGLKNNFLTNREQSKHGKFTLRMSSLGRPLCQTQMEKMGNAAYCSMYISGAAFWKFCQCVCVPHPPLRVSRFPG